MMFVCLLVALICCVNGYGDDVNVSDVYSVSTQTYTSTILQPYQWSYITVLYNVYDLPTMEAPALAIENQCYAIQGNITFTLTNEQITDGVLFIGIFNGIGAVRTQTKMMNKGKSYTFSAFALVEACNETNFWGEFCDKKLQRLQCYPLKEQFSECSIHTCHLPDMSPKLVFLNVENMATALILFVEKISINNTKHGFSSLIVYARNGAIPTNKLFDYTIDLTRNQLTIQLPKTGVWYFYIVPIMNNTTTTSNHMKQLKQLCYVLKWKLIKGINHQERSIYHVDGTNYMSNFPLTKIFQKENIGNPWICYFVMELPANASTRNIRIEMESNTSIECEVYARFGGLASHEMYDYYYVNQTNNSDDGLSLFKLYASSNRSLKFDIVYAQQGKWSFELRRHNLMTRLESETYLSISLAACPNNCSGYGKCSISANAQTSYSYCECDIFHGGFDCSIKIVPKFEQKLEIVFLVGSNAAAILPAICALFKKSYAELVIFLSSGVASAIYHACDAQWVCVIQYRILQFMDFWLSFVAIISIFLYMTSLSEAIKRAILSVVWILTAFMAIRDTTSSTNIVFVLVLGIACLLVPWLLQISTMCRTSSNLIQRPKIMTSSILKNLKNICRSFGWGFLVAAFVALALAATSWKLENNKNYWICHSIWHISVYTAAFFFLCSKVNSENEGSKPNVDNDVMVVPSESSETIII